MCMNIVEIRMPPPAQRAAPNDVVYMLNNKLYLAIAFHLLTSSRLLIAPFEGDFGREEGEDQREAVTSPRGPVPPPAKSQSPKFDVLKHVRFVLVHLCPQKLHDSPLHQVQI